VLLTIFSCFYWPFTHFLRKNVSSSPLIRLGFLFVLFHFSCRNSLYILDINSLSDIWFEKYFLPSPRFLFICLLCPLMHRGFYFYFIGECWWHWMTHITTASTNHGLNSEWVQWPVLWVTLPMNLGYLCLTRIQLTEFSVLVDAVENQGHLPDTCLMSLSFFQRMAIIAKWLFQLQGNMNDFFKQSDSTESACHGVWATWHNQQLSPPPFRVIQQ
jgi:hypothetical protein